MLNHTENSKHIDFLKFYNLALNSYGVRFSKINYDPDYFKVETTYSESFLPNKINLESIIFCSLELYSKNYLNNIKHSQVAFNFQKLGNSLIVSPKFLIEIDCFRDRNDFCFMEAYCYDENQLIIAKGSKLLIKS